jgi:hypothetical protein
VKNNASEIKTFKDGCELMRTSKANSLAVTPSANKLNTKEYFSRTETERQFQRVKVSRVVSLSRAISPLTLC